LQVASAFCIGVATRLSESTMNKLQPFMRENTADQPPFSFPDYKSTVARAPTKPLVHIPHTLTEVTGPGADAWERLMGQQTTDLTKQHKGEPIGERIIVSGRILDENGKGVPNTILEIWQANACGRYIHEGDQHDAPIDPNFTGAGHVLTDEQGNYRYITIKPGAYPWGNHYNAWRPQHIHLSLLGPSFATRLVTQMYFPGDPLMDLDPISQAVPAHSRGRMISRFDIETTIPDWALAYKFDIILRGREATPMEN